MRAHRPSDTAPLRRPRWKKRVEHDPFAPPPVQRKGSIEDRDAQERSLRDSTVVAWGVGLVGALGLLLGLNGIGLGWLLALLAASIAVSQISPPRR